jgi:hypothetical protein
MPACTALLPPSLQGHFLAAYTERATALEAEREGLKQHLREAHRQASCGQSSLATFRANGEPLGAPGAAETAASCRCCLPPGSPALTFPVLGSPPPPPSAAGEPGPGQDQAAAGSAGRCAGPQGGEQPAPRPAAALTRFYLQAARPAGPAPSMLGLNYSFAWR